MRKMKVKRIIASLCAAFMFASSSANFVPNAFATEISTEQFEYVENEVIALASSQEEAEEIAKLYNITLKSFAQGVAVFDTTTPETKVKQSQSIIDSDLPTLSLNKIYRMCETDDVGTQTEIQADKTVSATLTETQYHHGELYTEEAWEITTGENVVVAVIDTGADIDHTYLSGVISEKSYNSYTDSIGIEYVDDDHGHGTHVNGIIAANIASSTMVSGVAPNVELLVIKADRPSDNGFEIASLLRATNYAVANGADVINMSYGSDYTSGADADELQTIQDAVNAGIVVVCASGNYSDSDACYPAAYEETIAVSAVKEGYEFDSSYSNYGSQIDIAAQGTKIASTYLNNSFAYSTGTSMACPIVSAVAALIKSANPDYTVDDIKNALYDTAQEAGDLGWDQYYGNGIINAYAAVVDADELLTVTYDYNDNTRQSVSTKVVSGNTVIEPNDPTSSSLFLGWSLEDNSKNYFDFSSAITQDTTLYAIWSETEIAPSITTLTLPDGTYGEEYSQEIEYTGTEPITWSLESGTLPQGLELSEDGIISGTPTEIGASTFTVEANNYVGNETLELSIEINPMTVTVTPKSSQEKIYGEQDPTLEYETDITTDFAEELQLGITGALSRETGEDVGNYDINIGTLSASDNFELTIDENTVSFEIKAKDMSSTNETISTSVVSGLGNFAEPITEITGTTTYNLPENATATYDQAVEYLKDLTTGEIVNIDYTFTPNGNYTGKITGTITFTIVNFAFTGEMTVNTATYGDEWSEILDFSNHTYEATLNDEPITGTYELAVYYNDTLIDTDLIANVGEYKYQVTFTSTDNKYSNVIVCSETIEIGQLEADIAWGSTVLEYDGNSLLPTATVENAIDGDDISVEVIGEQTEVGEYTATIQSLYGDDSANYKLPSENITTDFTIFAKEIPTLEIEDISKTYDGVEITAEDIVGTATIDGIEIEGEWSFEDDLTFKDVTDDDYNVIFTPTENDIYATVTQIINIEIKTVSLAIKADDITAYTGDDEPDYTYTVYGLIENEELVTEPSSITCPLADMDDDGTYAITVSQDAEATDNYTITYANGTLTVVESSSTSSGSTTTTTTTTTTTSSSSSSSSTSSGTTSAWSGTTTTSGFTDVYSSDYYYDAVTWAVDNSITSGMSDTSFSPTTYCTRAQAVTFLLRAMGNPTSTLSNPFTDVPSSDYYYDAVIWALENNITSGITDTIFSPTANCTRGQIVTFLYRIAGEPEVSTTSVFTDVSSDSYCYNAVIWASENNITSGMTDTTFAPDTACTRGQIVTFLYRYFG